MQMSGNIKKKVQKFFRLKENFEAEGRNVEH